MGVKLSTSIFVYFAPVLALTIPAIHEAQKQLFCLIFFNYTVYQKSEGRFFDKGSIDIKSVLTFEK